MKKIFGLACAVLLLAGCSKDDKTTTCANEQARVSVTTEISESVNNVYTYTYDDQHRLISKKGNDQSYVNYTYNSNNTVTYKNGSVDATCTFDAKGRNVRVSQTNPGEKDTLVTFVYEYDNVGQMIRSYTHVFDNAHIYLQDSTLYTWRDGNLVQEDLLAPSQQTTKWYYTATDGFNMKNIPTLSSRWIYYPASTAVSSKNFPLKKEVSAKGRQTTTTSYTLETDKAGKIIRYTTDVGGSTTVYLLTYECI